MMSLWLGIGLLTAGAVGFLFWPLLKFGRDSDHITANDVADRLAENVRLFHEHIAELEAQLASGRLDQTQFAQLKLEHERALLADEVSMERSQRTVVAKVGIKSFIGLASILIAGSLWLYFDLGASEDVKLRRLIAQNQQQKYEDMQQNLAADPKRSRELIRLLEVRLKSDPEHLQYWFLLARTAMEVADFNRAVTAYEQTLGLDKESPLVMAELAQALFLRDGNQMSARAAGLANESLKREPNNSMALGLAGIDAFSRGDYPGAIKYWQKAIAILGEGSPGATSLAAGVDKAMTMYVAAGGDAASLQKAVDGQKIALSVSLAAGVEAAPDQLVYVYARAWQGAKVPLAITRIKVSDLPAQVVLTEAMAMSPAMTLATAEQIELVARISKDGGANAKSGDWQGSVGPVDMKAVPGTLQVVIDHQIAE